MQISTDRPEALDKACFVLVWIDGNHLVKVVEIVVEMNKENDHGISVQNYVDKRIWRKK